MEWWSDGNGVEHEDDLWPEVSPPWVLLTVNTVNTVNKAAFTERACLARVGTGERENRQPLTNQGLEAGRAAQQQMANSPDAH